MQPTGSVPPPARGASACLGCRRLTIVRPERAAPVRIVQAGTGEGIDDGAHGCLGLVRVCVVVMVRVALSDCVCVWLAHTEVGTGTPCVDHGPGAEP